MKRRGNKIDCSGSFIRADFIVLMNRELVNNSRTKGDWKTWLPDKLLLISEITWHFSKFVQALMIDNREKISEYAADIANYAMKADETFGTGSEQK